MAASTCGLDDAELVLAIWCRSMGSTRPSRLAGVLGRESKKGSVRYKTETKGGIAVAS